MSGIKLDNTYVIECKSGVKIYGFTQEHYELIHATLIECISLLSVSGNNTKSIVLEKLRGIVE